MAEDFRDKARECLKNADYRGYVEFAEKQYKRSNDGEDLEEVEKARKLLQLSIEISEILKMEGQDSYKILGVDSSTPLSDIKRKFREKASRYHPNRAPVKGSQDAFRIIQEAYFEINTEEKKALYDSKKRSGSFFFNSQPMYTQPPSPLYTQRTVPNLFSYSFGSGQFVFSTASPAFWPFRFNEAVFEDIYSHLYRNTRMHQRPQQHGERPALLISIILLVILVLFNLLG